MVRKKVKDAKVGVRFPGQVLVPLEGQGAFKVPRSDMAGRVVDSCPWSGRKGGSVCFGVQGQVLDSQQEAKGC